MSLSCGQPKVWCSRTRLVAMVCLTVITSAFPGSAVAQPAHDPGAAGAAFVRARDAIKRGEIELACELFGESVRLDPAPGAILNLADCDEQRRRFASASQEFKDAIAKLPESDRRVEIAKQKIAALESRVPKLTIALVPGAPIGATVERDGVLVSSPSLGSPIPVDPGDHEIVVRAPRHQPKATRIAIAEGERKTIEVPAGEPLPPEPRAPRADVPRRQERSSLVLPVSVVTAGTIITAGGAILGVMTLDRASTVKEHCIPGCDDVGYDAGQQGRWMSVASPVALGVGLALVGAGLWFWLHPSKKVPTTMALSW
jgi:hypothetical protein